MEKKIFEIEFKGLQENIKRLAELDRELYKIKEENKKLNITTQEGSQELAKNSIETKILTEEKRKLEATTRAQIQLGEKEILTLEQVSQQLTIERQKIRQLEVGSKDFYIVGQRIKNLEKKQREYNAAIGRGKTFVGEYVRGIKAGFSQIGLVVGGAIMAFNTIKNVVGGAIEKFKIQEQAVHDNMEVFGSYSYELQRVAADIQKVTTVGDEQSLALMTQAKNLGISNSKVIEATKGAIGLAEMFKKVGLSQEEALKGIALAYNGNFEQLSGYIPALRTARDETEKMTILQKAMAEGFNQATENAKSSTGKMDQFSNRMSDVEEKFGEIAHTAKVAMLPILEYVADVLETVANHAKELFLGKSFSNKVKIVWNGIVDTVLFVLKPVNALIKYLTGTDLIDKIKFDVDKSIEEEKRLEKKRAIIAEGGLRGAILRTNERMRLLLKEGKISKETVLKTLKHEHELLELDKKRKEAKKAFYLELQKAADAIQKVTTIEKKQSLALMTQAKKLGIVNSKVIEATKGAIGLAWMFKKAGLNQEEALKGIALAYKGNFEQLSKYIPALRTARDEAKKMTILQKAMAKGFEQASKKIVVGKPEGIKYDSAPKREKDGIEKIESLFVIEPKTTPETKEKFRIIGAEYSDAIFEGYKKRSEEYTAEAVGSEGFIDNLKFFLADPKNKEALKKAAVDSFAEIGNAVLDGQKARIDAEMEYRNKAINEEYDRELESYNALKENGLLTEEQFNAKKDALNRKREQQEEALRMRAFNQQKKLDAAAVIMNAGVAYLKQWATTPPPIGAPFFIALAATTATQLGLIAARKYPKFAAGGIVPSGYESLGGYDNTLIAAHPGEVVLTAEHQRLLGGPETFKRIGVPGFATGGIVPPQAPILTAEEVANIIRSVKVINVATDTTAMSNKVYNLQSSYEI